MADPDRLISLRPDQPPGSQLPTPVSDEIAVVANNAVGNRIADEITNQNIPGQVVAAVEAAPTVTDAAAGAATTAVATAISEADLISGSDPRVPSAGEDDAFRVRDKAGRTTMRVTDVVDVGQTTMKPDGRWYAGYRVMDKDDMLAFEIREDGTVFVGQFADDSDGASPGVETVHVLIAAGQSNMAGMARPTNAEIDRPHPRIFQYGADAGTISTATVPLDMPGSNPTGISPITFIARSLLQRIGPNDVVLIIPGAKGGSQVAGSTDTNANGVWNVSYAGASLNLYAMLKAQITAAMSAVSVKWPGATKNVVGLFWHQGEANSDFGTVDGYATETAAYASRIDAMFGDLRTYLSDSDMPITLGGMVPEYIASRTYTVAAAHIDTPKRLLRTAYADGVANGGGYDTDLVHYQREGCAELARRMLAGYDRALLNTTDSEPHPPLSVSATLISGVLTVKWSQPYCRYTAFTPEYSTDGSTWTAITHTDVSTTAVKTGVTGPVQVRMSTTNDVGTSATTTPVYAVSGG